MPSKKSDPKTCTAKEDLKYRRLSAIPGLVAGLGLIAAAFPMRPRIAWTVMLAAGCALLMHSALLFIKKRLPIIVYCLTTAVCVALIAFIPWHVTMIPFGEDLIRYTETELQLTEDPPETISYMQNLRKLDLRGSSIRDFTPFMALKHLRSIDVRDNYAFSRQTRLAFAEALPDCDVLWSVPVAGEYYDSDTALVDLRDKQLTVQELTTILTEQPDLKYRYSVDIFGQRVDDDAESLVLVKSDTYDAAALREALTVLPAVNAIDLSAKPMDLQSVQDLETAYPDIAFNFTYKVSGMKLRGDDKLVVVPADASAEDLQTLEAVIPRLAALQTIDLRNLVLTTDQIETLTSRYPDIRFEYKYSILGVEVTSESTELDLSGIQINDLDQLEQQLKKLPNLKTVYMLKCGIADERMAQLRDALPDKKVVWSVQFARWTVRTDATAFSTMMWADRSCHWGSETYAPLQYCTDLMYLDLGHNCISDLEFLRPLKKLRILILACNDIGDISPLEDLMDLEYVELFTNHLRDLSPLADHMHLIDLNINCNWVNGIDPLCGLTSLKRLWVGDCRLSSAQLNKLRTSLPECEVNTSAGGAPTTAGWRKNKHYNTIQKINNEKKYIPFWDSFPIEDDDAVTAQAEPAVPAE